MNVEKSATTYAPALNSRIRGTVEGAGEEVNISVHGDVDAITPN